jgi:hydroxyacylglutathione hydrolase
VNSNIEIIRSGAVNCYPIHEGENYFLVDSGFSSKREELVNRLAGAGCKRGNMKLVILTHGDLDHTGNGAFLREKFKPDLFLENSQDLSSFGLSARVVWTPGHSRGSISILTADGDLFSGHLFYAADQVLHAHWLYQEHSCPFL